MPTKNRSIIEIHHPLADIKIRPTHPEDSIVLESSISEILDELFVKEGRVPASVIHEDGRKEHGDYYDTPGYSLNLYRHREGFTQAKLAEALNIHQHHISEMEKNKRAISRKMAMEIGKILHCNYRDLL